MFLSAKFLGEFPYNLKMVDIGNKYFLQQLHSTSTHSTHEPLRCLSSDSAEFGPGRGGP